MEYMDSYNLWLSKVDADERRELESLRGDDKEIKERFYSPLEFGTAGMRGVLGMGTHMMNKYTVMRATEGLAHYVQSLGAEAMARGVLISYDTRRFSFEFAKIAAEVLAKNGVHAYIFENVRPVPMCSFAVRYVGAVAGIMITASHNPKEYNGYKVYGEDGAQMSPVATAKVVEFIDEIEDYFGVDRVETGAREEFIGKDNYDIVDNITVVGKTIDNAYFDAIEQVSLSPEAVKAVGKDIKIVYTPIHGAGYMPVTTILARMGIKVNVVEEQANPDTEFSTVAVPNPEQPDALKMGMELANKLGSDIVIGTDPDSDRMGVAIRNNANEFILLNGNQIGALLLDYILTRRTEEGTLPTNGAIVKTIVTTSLADKIATSHNVAVYNVLTGFKFIGEKIKEWEKSGEHTFLFGYEESYGYLSGTHARDKDAVVSAMLFAEMVCYYESKGIKLYNHLIDLFERYGYFVEKSVAIVFKGLDGMEKMANIMEELRNNPKDNIKGYAVKNFLDFKKGVSTCVETGATTPIDLPSANVIKYDLGDDEWVAVRPSGTEPKLKVYVSVHAKSHAEAVAKNAKLFEEFAF